ncbi:type I secretion protein [Ruegeria arenilitoris]|uniref:type I secretion protein n=1 Tax=Ruegeria arenilitoris TaxID=1173585 RepID=UPI001480C0EA|nr:type I secretion protein [Ruegeria arenilitoris]
MSFDSVTEKIAHFIGTFDLTIEQARLRDQYEEFTALRRKFELEELEDPTIITIRAELSPEEGAYKPLPYKFFTPPIDPTPSTYSGAPFEETVINVGQPFVAGPLFSENLPIGSTEVKFNVVPVQPEIEAEQPIGSAVTYTFQSLVLSDNDTIGEGDFRDADELIAEAEEATQVATSLHAVSAPSYSIADYLSIDYVKALAQEMLSPSISNLEGVTVHQFHGADALGIIVNGEYVDEAPEWDELLPSFHKKEQVDEETSPDPFPAEWDRDDEDEFNDGHSVVTGGNLAINEVSATVAWIDAPYIAVGGQSVSLTMISQVAVVSDMDVGAPANKSGTNVVQTSHISVEENPAYWIDDSAENEGQPEWITIDWINGDLIVSNFVKQETDATDIDHIGTEISASTTLYALGDNEMVNVSNIIQLGSYYDLVMVGGDMISIDILMQTLVLMDDDVVSGGMAGVEDGADENLLMNMASVNTTGRDVHEELNDDLSAAMDLTESDIDALHDALLNDPTFAGMEQLRVLNIEGNLLQVNVFEQVTVLADQDDVHLHGPNAHATEVVAGSNAMLNAANIVKSGVDSTVMAAEGEYSDLLLHQASLIDVPSHEEVEEIANEAIALIMDEMNVPGDETGIGPKGNDLTPGEMAETTDGLQTLLA